ncbi:MAG: RHS repeat-associated core domain-containing protein [Candidatus Binatus sp.]
MSDDGPFGATASSGAASDNPYQFAGRELDPNGGFGIYYFRARYYDSLELNRFLERDPQGLSGGNYAALYAYVGNSPLNGTDPTGQYGIFGFATPSSLWDGFGALEDGFAVDAGIAGATADQVSLAQADAANGASAQGGAQGDSGSITTGSSPPPGTISTWQYSATQTATLSVSGQWLFNTSDGQYSIVPGVGVGVSLTITNDDDVPLFTSTFGVGKFGGASIGIVTGYNVFTGFPDYAGIVITGGIGFAPSPYSVLWPQ